MFTNLTYYIRKREKFIFKNIDHINKYVFGVLHFLLGVY